MDKIQAFCDEVIELVKTEKISKEELSKRKLKLCKKHIIAKPPTDIQILLHAKEEDLPLLNALQTKPVRSISGVAVIAIMSAPFACPHGKCTMCPGGPESHFGDVPQSYTGKEPSTMRGIRNDYDAYLMVFNRLEQYIVTGHVPDKVELIVMGGTFPAFPKEYTEGFITDTYKAMNDFSDMFFTDDKLDFKKFKEFFELPGEVGNKQRTENIQQKLRKQKVENRLTLEEEQKKNENAKIRCIGLTIETKPDWALKEECDAMLRWGATRVELGVQTVYDDVLAATNRGHDMEDSKQAIRILRDAGFKLNFHLMLGLPGVTKDMDENALKEIFDDPAYKPDMIKIYPCSVFPGTALYDDWKADKFEAITTPEAAELIAHAKRYIPAYCRIMRVQRDIPSTLVEAGVDKTNLRQYVKKICDKEDIKCRCIRCREVGRAKIAGEPWIVVEEYDAAGGKEFFISFEDTKNDVLYGFCRLRFPGKSHRPEITEDSAIIRELHVYGSAVAVGDTGEVQHRGFGKRLVAKAEEIAKQHGKSKMVVISGVGVKQYYARLQYEKDGPYMSKPL